jgi:hypothetical protein
MRLLPLALVLAGLVAGADARPHEQPAPLVTGGLAGTESGGQGSTANWVSWLTGFGWGEGRLDLLVRLALVPLPAIALAHASIHRIVSADGRHIPRC